MNGKLAALNLQGTSSELNGKEQEDMNVDIHTHHILSKMNRTTINSKNNPNNNNNNTIKSEKKSWRHSEILFTGMFYTMKNRTENLLHK